MHKEGRNLQKIGTKVRNGKVNPLENTALHRFAWYRDLEGNLHFEIAIDFIEKSSHINVLGTRPYKATALYFEQLLGEFYSKIRQLGHDTEVIFDRILQFEKDEILVVFAFEPYTNRVIEAVKLAYELGNSNILITDYI